MEIPLLRGRFFNAQRVLSSGSVAVIDETLAKRYFAGENPIGQHLKMPWATYQIVGVVGSVKVTGLDIDAPPTIYFSSPSGTLVIRSNLPDGRADERCPTDRAQIDKDQPVHEVSLLETYVNHSLKTRRFVVFLVTLFGAAGTLLSASGSTVCFPIRLRCGAAS